MHNLALRQLPAMMLAAEKSPHHLRTDRSAVIRHLRNRKGKRRLHPVDAQTKTQNRKMVLGHGGAPLMAESEVGRLSARTG